MKSATSIATIQELRRLFAAYGLPVQLVSDNGPQFTLSEFMTFLKGNEWNNNVHLIISHLMVQLKGLCYLSREP